MSPVYPADIMKRRCLAACSLMLLVAGSAPAWHNGKRTTKVSNPFFGGHDYIAWKGYKLAAVDTNLNWIKLNDLAFFLGTEAPDNPNLPTIGGENGYGDTLQCHCINYDPQGNVTKDRAAKRAQEEFDKAKAALASGNRRMAAYYAGAMTHYIADLAQFCHLMSPDGPWGDDEATLHSRYEEVIDKTMDVKTRTNSVLETYVKKRTVSGDKPYDIALAVADFTGHGGGTVRNPKWMWTRLTAYEAAGNETDPTKWSKAFRDQTGANVNYAVNGIAKALKAIGN